MGVGALGMEEENYELDAVLLTRFCRGDAAAFDMVFNRHYGFVYAVCKRELGAHEAAEDAAYATFIILVRKAKTVRTHRSLCSWLYGAAMLACKQARRIEARRIRAVAGYAAHLGEQGSATADELAVRMALSRLKEADQQTLILRYALEYSHGEIGAHLGIQEDAARMRVQRALGALRQKMGLREAALVPLMKDLAPPAEGPRLGVTGSRIAEASMNSATENTHMIEIANATGLALKLGALKAVGLVAGSLLAIGAIKVSTTHPESVAATHGFVQRARQVPASMPTSGHNSIAMELTVWRVGSEASTKQTGLMRFPTPGNVPFKSIFAGGPTVAGQGVKPPFMNLLLAADGTDERATVHLTLLIKEPAGSNAVEETNAQSTFVLQRNQPMGVIPRLAPVKVSGADDNNFAPMLKGQATSPWRVVLRLLPAPDLPTGPQTLCAMTFVRNHKVQSAPTIRTLDGQLVTLKSQVEGFTVQTAYTVTREGSGFHLKGTVDAGYSHSPFDATVANPDQDTLVLVLHQDGDYWTVAKKVASPSIAVAQASGQQRLAQMFGAADDDLIVTFTTKSQEDPKPRP